MAVIPSGGGGGGGGGAGWIRIADVAAPGGVVINKVWQDPPGNTVLQSATISQLSITVTLRASYPNVDVGGTLATLSLAPDGGHYQGVVAVTLASAGTLAATVIDPNGAAGATDNVDLALEAPPNILTLAFTGGYPGSQTELKEGDIFQVAGTASKTVDLVEILDYEACQLASIPVTPGLAFAVTTTIADRGNAAVARPARVRVRDAVTGAYSATRDTNTGGGTVDGVNVVTCNNLGPTAVWGVITYPPTQQALKGAEQATVGLTIANASSIFCDSPTAELSVTNPSLVEPTKTVTRIGGSYNVGTNNLRVTANRAPNDKDTVAQVVVNIAAVAAQVSIAEPAARLRSGGNDGTAAQDHTITITSNQQLQSAPSVDAAVGAGTWQGSWAGGPSVWTRALRVHDDDSKGTFSWSNLLATNLAGIPTTAITGDSQYVLGGFVSRTVTWDAFQTVSRNVNVEVVDFAKLQAGLFSATNQQSVKWPIGTAPPKVDGYTISALAAKPHTVTWLDTAAAGSNSGEAYLFTYQETV